MVEIVEIDDDDVQIVQIGDENNAEVEGVEIDVNNAEEKGEPEVDRIESKPKWSKRKRLGYKIRQKGPGVPLQLLPNVAFKICFCASDEVLSSLHQICFSAKAKDTVLRRNLGHFSGFSDTVDKSSLKTTMGCLALEKLDELLFVLDLPPVESKELREIYEILLNFLERPCHVSSPLSLDVLRLHVQHEALFKTWLGKFCMENLTSPHYPEFEDTKWSMSSDHKCCMKGSGVPLRLIPNVAFKLCFLASDDALSCLHEYLFSKKAMGRVLRKKLGDFSGFPSTVDKTRMFTRLNDIPSQLMFEIYCVIDLPFDPSLSMKDRRHNIFKFLESPCCLSSILLLEVANMRMEYSTLFKLWLPELKKSKIGVSADFVLLIGQENRGDVALSHTAIVKKNRGDVALIHIAIGKKEPLDSLLPEYADSGDILNRIRDISQEFSHFRRVSDDGDGFYASFLFSFLVHLTRNGPNQSIRANIGSDLLILDSLGYDVSCFEDFNHILDHVEGNRRSEEELASCCEGAAIWCLRCLMAAGLMRESAKYLPLVPAPCIKEFVAEHVMKMGEKTELWHLDALAYSLDICFGVIYATPEDGIVRRLFGMRSRWFGREVNSFDRRPLFVLFFCAGHYDILYSPP